MNRFIFMDKIVIFQTFTKHNYPAEPWAADCSAALYRKNEVAAAGGVFEVLDGLDGPAQREGLVDHCQDDCPAESPVTHPLLLFDAIAMCTARRRADPDCP